MRKDLQVDRGGMQAALAELRAVLSAEINGRREAVNKATRLAEGVAVAQERSVLGWTEDMGACRVRLDGLEKSVAAAADRATAAVATQKEVAQQQQLQLQHQDVLARVHEHTTRIDSTIATLRLDLDSHVTQLQQQLQAQQISLQQQNQQQMQSQMSRLLLRQGADD
jgi:predicted  nucleic acid-binding Zn-ribbon protein